ncbi:hypothetical protein FEM48_Zijuj10G0133700 [Ziziphus jujuba var. spinosa]|uniref:Beta-amyrin 28-oxidase-like n=1 Tax=Ziziphus jujuba var. spinosa TaxID=714518 RepID=A0A978UNM1_ZIZJJ|nr:hypothetical protein FEM48_Zijuj10G0133700 [Ziziphus jujuba var. spinosa]
MDNFLLSFSVILPIFFAIFIFHALKPKSNGKPEKLPPGSFGFPIVGEAISFLYQNHDKFISHRMGKHSSKIFKTNLLGDPVVVLCGTAGHKFIASNELQIFQSWRPQSMQKLFRSSIQPPSSSSSSSTSITRETEKQITRAPGFMRTDALVHYVGIMDGAVQEHLKNHWVGKEIVNVHRQAQLLFLTLAGRFFMGLEDSARIEKLSNLMHKIMLSLDVLPLNVPGTSFYNGMKAAKEVRQEIQLLIKEKKTAMDNGAQMQDILSFMISRPDPSTGKPLLDADVADKVMGLLSGAFNSPSISVSFIMKFLGERPEIYEKVRYEQLEIASSKQVGEALTWEDVQKMKYSWNVALEVMRLRPPTRGLFREALTDFKYEGYTIPKGWKVYWTVCSTKMDPECFPEPEKFDPTRYAIEGPPPYTNVPFGSGPRTCPGKDYARLQILTFLHHVVKRFNWEVMNSDCKVLGGTNPVPYEGVHVRLHSSSV